MRYIEQLGKTDECFENFALEGHSGSWKYFWAAGIGVLGLLIKDLFQWGDFLKSRKASLIPYLNNAKMCCIVLIALYVIYAIFIVFIPYKIRSADEHKTKRRGLLIFVHLAYYCLLIFFIFWCVLLLHKINFEYDSFGKEFYLLVFHILSVSMIAAGHPFIRLNALGSCEELKLKKVILADLLYAIVWFLWVSLISVFVVALMQSAMSQVMLNVIATLKLLLSKMIIPAGIGVGIFALRLRNRIVRNADFKYLLKRHAAVMTDVRTFLEEHAKEQNPELFGFRTVEKWMTNTEALRYYEEKYGPDPSNIDWNNAADAEILPHIFDLSYRSVQIKKHFTSLGYFRDKFYQTFLWIQDKNGAAKIRELEKPYNNDFSIPEASFNKIADVKKNIFGIDLVINNEINQYAALKHGYTGENQVLGYLRNILFTNYPETVLIENCNLIGKDKKHSAEHDLIIINRKGVTTVEIKNYSGEIRVEGTGMTTIDGETVEEGKNFIMQSNNHVSNLIGFLDEKHYNCRVNGAIVFASTDANVINNSDYPIFVYPMFVTYMNRLSDCIDPKEVDKIAESINRRSRSEKKFPHTVYEISDDFRKNFRTKIDNFEKLSILLEDGRKSMLNVYDYPEKQY